MKKILSYILPFGKKIPSEINGPLEINWQNGTKVLDSKNANYSYGSLERLLNYGVSQIYFDQKADILLLGLGGGSIIKSLQKKFRHQGKITAVEIDPVIIKLAHSEFDIYKTEKLDIIEADAFSYVTSCVDTFHLIIIDLFIDQKVPSPFYSIPFWKAILKLLKPKGSVLFNAGIHLQDDLPIEKIRNNFSKSVAFTQYDQVNGTNTLHIGRKL